MAVEFSELLFRSLPGLYRDKDTTGQLRSFLEIAALPLTEIEASISQLHEDQFVATCRPAFIGLIGALIGADVDATLPEKAQRAEVQHAIERYRTKGLLPAIERLAEEITGWRINIVDLSQTLAQTFALDSTSLPRSHTIDLRDQSTIARLGRVDDPASYSLDVRAPRHPRERIGEKHFDNLGLFFAPSRIIVNQRPNVLPPGSGRGRFTFDSRRLDAGDDRGVRLQLLDGLDGEPLTRRSLQGRERDFCGTRRGFTIRASGDSITDPARMPPLRIHSANLEDFDHPKDPDGEDLPVEPGEPGQATRADVAIDPQLGRILMNLDVVGTTAEDVSVDYLLAAVEEVRLGVAFLLSTNSRELFSFSADGANAELRDAFDGSSIAASMRLGVPVSDYHGTVRGWQIFRKKRRSSARRLPWTSAICRAMVALAVPAGYVAVDPVRGRFKFAPDFIGSTDRVAVNFAFEREATVEQVVLSLLQHLPRALPAGVVPVVIDVRRRAVDPAHLP